MPTAVLVADIHKLNRTLEKHGRTQTVKVIEEFAAISQEVIEPLGGNLVHIWADQVVILFRTSAQAVRAALEAQKRYACVSMPGGGPLHVGIGLAAGEVIWVLTGHVGAAIDRATQLCGLAGPGQTLVDERVREEIREMRGVQFREMAPLCSPSVGGASEVVAGDVVGLLGSNGTSSSSAER